MISDAINIVDDHLIVVSSKFGDGGEHNKGYLVGKDELAIIDTGNRSQGLPSQFEQAIYDKGKDLKDVKYIFLTHYHPDTAGDIINFKKKFPKAKVAINEKCKEVVKAPNDYLKTENFNFGTKERLYFAIKRDPFDKMDSIEPEILFKDGHKFKLGSSSIMAINFDGHCKGHTMYFYTGNRTMFCGDALNMYPAIPYSYLIDNSGNYKSWLKNIQFLEKAKMSYLCPAHDIFQQDKYIYAYVDDVIRGFRETELAIEDVMSEKKYLSLEEIAERTEQSIGMIWYYPYLGIASEANMKAHIKKLMDENKVQMNKKTKPLTYTWTAKSDTYW